MTAPNTTFSGVGARQARAFALNAAGLPNATATTAYEGWLLGGLKALNVTDPEPRVINHTGDDGVFAIDSLPAQEAMGGDFMTGKVDLDFEAYIRTQKVITVGEKKGIAIGTDKRGFEPQVALTFFRQALDTTQGAVQLQRWEMKIFPLCKVIAIEGGFSETPQETKYVIRPMFTGKHIWGTALSETDDGAIRAQELKWVTVYKPKVIAFLADGVEDAFLFPTAYPNAAAAKADVWVNGVKKTTGITITTTSITFDPVPAEDDLIVVFYEYL